MVKHISKYSVYYAISIAFILVGLVLQLGTAKGEYVLLFNENQTDGWNQFFLWATRLAEWMGGTIVFLVLLFTSRFKYLLIFGIAIVTTTLAAQALKHTVFKDEHRPAYHYEQLNEIEDLERHQQNSFPSGHTTAAFTFYSILAFALANKRYQLICAVLAVIGGVSRIYLGQHFLNDVVAGAVLGLLLSTILFIVLDRKLNAYPKLNQKWIGKNQ